MTLKNEVIFSIIIPFKGSTETLFRLFDTIPKSNQIEIILVENSDNPLSKREIGIERQYLLLNAPSKKYAGGARNVGLSVAKGRWLIFADADDYFEEDAFQIFESYDKSEYDLIYFGCNSVFDDTLQPSDRHLMYQGLIDNYLKGIFPVMKTRLYHVVPWAKMIRRSLVEDNHIQFDEVIAANDMFFATQVGFYSKSFHADSRSVYVVTTRRGSLANTWNHDILYSRYIVGLRRNQFLKQHGLSEYQVSVMIYLHKAMKISFRLFLRFVLIGIQYRQNLFVGYRNWFRTKQRIEDKEKKTKDYIVTNK